MKNPNSKPVKIGYRFGLILFICGLVLVGINVGMLYFSDSYYPKLVTMGMAVTILSLIFFIFPGGSVAKMPEGKDLNKVFWQNAPVIHKVMWIVWGIVSIGIAFFLLINFDPDFLQ